MTSLVVEIPGRQFREAEVCKACGLSVFRSIDDARKLRRRVRASRKRMIAKGTVSDQCGKMMPTPSRQEPTHTTFWVFAEVALEGMFRVVAEEQKPQEPQESS